MTSRRSLLLRSVLAAATLLGAAKLPPSTLSLSKWGIGRLDPSTPATVEAFTKAFDGYAISRGVDTMEDEAVGTQLVVRWQGKVVLIAHTDGRESTTLSTVEVRSRDVSGPHGIRVGDRFSAVLQRGAVHCRRGEEQLASSVYCADAEQPLFAYQGDVADLGTAGATLADDEVPPPDLLKKLRVRAIIWQAQEAAKTLPAPAPGALSPAERALVARGTADLTAEEKATIAGESDGRKMADFLCQPRAEAEIKKKLPAADRVVLGSDFEKDPNGALLFTGNTLSGAGSARVPNGWQQFTFTCTVDPGTATATGFVFTPGALQRW